MHLRVAAAVVNHPRPRGRGSVEAGRTASHLAIGPTILDHVVEAPLKQRQRWRTAGTAAPILDHVVEAPLKPDLTLAMPVRRPPILDHVVEAPLKRGEPDSLDTVL